MRPSSLDPADTPSDGIELQLPLDIPVSLAPRSSHSLAGPVAPHALLARAQNRLVILSLFFFCFFLIVLLRLVDATLFQGMRKAGAEGTEAAVASGVSAGDPARPGQGFRVNITDRNGELLATSLPAKSLYADPARVMDAPVVARAVVKVLPDLAYRDVLDKLTSGKRFVWLKRNLTPEEVYRVNALGQPGLDFQTEYVRIYPAGSSTTHVVGVTDVDGHGLAGVERGLNGRIIAGGAPVVLSLDLRLQHIVERELKAALSLFRAVGATAVVMDAWSGEVLAAVSLPTYAPTDSGAAGDEARFNRFSLGTYELGSVMKVINTAAALESRRISLGDFFDASAPLTFGRFTINDYHPVHRALSVAEIFLLSSNIGSARMALLMGPDFQKKFFCRLGLCETLRTEIPETGFPQVPRTWQDINAMTIAFGHGIATTPLQFVRAAAATLNGGHLVDPTFLKQESVTGPAGPVVMNARTVDQMRRVMRANVTDKEGSGKKADVPGYFVGGKTGTAEKTQGKRYNRNARLSSFLGAFPMQDPRYVVFVVLDEPQPGPDTYGFATGGWVAAPVVGHIIAQMGPLFGIAPMDPDDPTIQKALTLTIRTRDPDRAAD